MANGGNAMEKVMGSTLYSLPPSPLCDEDILFCVDVDLETMDEMKISSRQVVTRLDSIKQAIILFASSKLTMNPAHHFAFSLLAQSASWLQKEFTGDVDLIKGMLKELSAEASYEHADLTQLFRIATDEAQKSRSRSRTLRVILIYCRSSVIPEHEWTTAQKLFTLDVIYIHQKPGPGNCPQKVYDTLVDTLEHLSEGEGYAFECGQNPRVLFRHMCVLLSHPQQRCVQDYLDVPKPLTKKAAAAETVPSEEGSVISSQ